MDNNNLKALEKLKEVGMLVEKFKSQSEQLQSAKDTFKLCQEKALEKLHEAISKIQEVRNEISTVAENAEWFTKAVEDLGENNSILAEHIDLLKDVFDEEKLKKACANIEDLTQIVEECKLLRDELKQFKTSIIEEINKTIECFIAAKQAENRAYLDKKFEELFKKLSSQTLEINKE